MRDVPVKCVTLGTSYSRGLTWPDFHSTQAWYNEIVHPDTDAPLEEHVIAVRSFPNLHLELYQPDVTDDAVAPETSC